MGLEPTTFGSEVRRAIHYATGPNIETHSVNLLKTQSLTLPVIPVTAEMKASASIQY